MPIAPFSVRPRSKGFTLCRPRNSEFLRYSGRSLGHWIAITSLCAIHACIQRRGNYWFVMLIGAHACTEGGVI